MLLEFTQTNGLKLKIDDSRIDGYAPYKESTIIHLKNRKTFSVKNHYCTSQPNLPSVQTILAGEKVRKK